MAKSESARANAVFRNMNVAERHFYESNSSDRQYEVQVCHDGKISCNCRGWTFMKHGRRDCSHCHYVSAKTGRTLYWDADGISHLRND